VLKEIAHHRDNLQECMGIVGSALILVFAIAGFVSIGGCLIADALGTLLGSPQVGQGVFLAMPGLLFFSLNKVLINILNGFNRMRAYAVFRTIRFTLIPLTTCGIAVSQLPAPYLALSLTFSELLLCLGLLFYVNNRLLPLRVFSGMSRWLQAHFQFGIRSMLSGVLSGLQVDTLVLGYLSNDTTVGAYSFAAMLAQGFSQIPIAVRWNIDPIIGSYFAEQEEGKIRRLARRVRKVVYPSMLVLSVVAILFYPALYSVLAFDDHLFISWSVFSLIMIGVVISSGYRPLGGVLLQGGRPGAHTLFMTQLVLVTTVMNLLLIPFFGVLGAAIAMMLSQVLIAVLLIVHAQKQFGIRL
jgi:O-antigen/teichoic acid export membrane protein